MLNHKGTQSIKTERFLLRRFTIDDAQDMYDNWAIDEAVCKFLSWDPHPDVGHTRELLRIWVDRYDQANCYNWVVEWQGSAIGSISVVNMSERNRYCEIGYCLSHAHWGQNVMTEALGAVITAMFDIGFHRVEAQHDIDNPASGRVMEKCGMQSEGVRMQRTLRRDGTFGNIRSWGIVNNRV